MKRPESPAEASHVNYAFTAEEQRPPADTPSPSSSARGQLSSGGTRRAFVCALGPVTALLMVAAVTVSALWYCGLVECWRGRRCPGSRVCVAHAQWCDGEPDCPSGADEDQCFRLYGAEFRLQMFTTGAGGWEDVCWDGWSDELGRLVCEEMGYSGETYVGFSAVASDSSQTRVMLKTEALRPYYHSERSVCPSLHSLTLHCIACGGSDRMRVVGGQAVTSLSRWPWQVSLQYQGQHLCGGSVISPHWILTAAHCVHQFSDAGQWRVFAGHLTLSSMRRSSGSSVQLILSHRFHPASSENDVALMKLSSPLRSSDVIPVCLPNHGMFFSAPRDCYVTGWGSVTSGDSSSDSLQEAEVQLIDRRTCNRDEAYGGQVSGSMLCAGKLQGGVDSCQGDSGGPLVTREGSLWWLVGGTSWGDGCAVRNKPGVYANVTYFLSWILMQMRIN